MAGEVENVQIVLDGGLVYGGHPTMTIVFSAATTKPASTGTSSQITTATTATTTTTAATIPAAAWTAKTVGYVNCSTTTRYNPSGGGWQPDPLFSSTFDGGAATQVNGDVTNSVYVSLAIPRGTAAGKYTGTVKVTYGTGLGTYTLPLHVDVWAASLPAPESMFKSFGEIWSFTFNQFTGDSTKNETTLEYMEMMTKHLVPPDNLYKSAPYSDFGVYEYLNKTGKHLLNLADISNLDGSYDTACSKPYTKAYIDSTLAMLEPTVNKLKASGILDTKQAYVYGYDEQPPSCEANIRALFGAVKAKWPFITTAAVLNWPGGLPVDLPVDVWILQYEDYNAENAKRWKAAGKRQFWYEQRTAVHTPKSSGIAHFLIPHVLNVPSGSLCYPVSVLMHAQC